MIMEAYSTTTDLVPLMQLRHYTEQPDLIVPTTMKQSLDHQVSMTGKPVGLWVSVLGEDDWPSWCRSEQWGTDRITYEHEVRLVPGARILKLSSITDIKEFSDRYGQVEGLLGAASVLRSGRRGGWIIDWPRLEREGWHGIVIAPYCWEARLNYMWYYGWDCASGCIWNAEAIHSITLLGLTPSAKEEEEQT